MKVSLLYDHQIFSWQQYGGISRYFYEIISRVSQSSQVSAMVHMGLHVNQYGLEKFRDNFSAFNGYYHPAIPKTGRIFLRLNDMLFSQCFRNTDAMIYHSTFYDTLLPDFKGKRIITVHDMVHEMYPHLFSAKDKLASYKRKAVESADGIICVSEYTKRKLLEILDFPEHKIKVIYLGNPFPPKNISPAIVKAPYILYVGPRSGYKNFNILLSAYKQSSQIHNNFQLVCFGGGIFTSNEKAMLDDSGMSGKVLYFTGSDEILANLYQHAALFVYPSICEGFGIPPLEAMHFGCPVLVSSATSIPEVVGEAGLYFDPYNMEELQEKMEVILTNDNLRRQLVAKGYLQKDKFSWDKAAKETISFYMECVK